MNVKVDEAINNGIYLDKETNTFVDNTESINLVIYDGAISKVEKSVEVISNIIGLSEIEQAIYKALIVAQTKGKTSLNIAENVPKIAELYDKSERGVYKAIKNLVNKRIISYKGVNSIQLNIGYNFAEPLMKEPKFIIIRLID